MSEPAYAVLTVVRGSSKKWRFVHKTDGVVTNLSGYGAQFRAVYRDLAIEKTAPASLSIEEADGIVELSLTPAETRSIPTGQRMKFELEVTEPGGGQIVTLRGMFNATGGLNDD